MRITVRANQLVAVDGVTIGKVEVKSGEVCLSVQDKCKRRSAERGSSTISIPLKSLEEGLAKLKGKTSFEFSIDS